MATRIDSFSSIEESEDTKVRFKDLGSSWFDPAKKGLKVLKRQNPKAGKVVFKGKGHQSSTVAEHTDVISVQIRDKGERYMGSGHIDAHGNVYPNKAWVKNLRK